MKEAPDILAADATGEGGDGKIYRRSPPRRHMKRSPDSLSVCTRRMAGRTDTTSKIGCVPNRSSCGTTRNCEVPTNRDDAFEMASVDQRVWL